MLNAERFKEKILDVVEDDKKYNFAIKDDDPNAFFNCHSDISCKNCIFTILKNGKNCLYNRFNWLLSEYKEKIILSKFEYNILEKAHNRRFEYIIRKECGGLRAYRCKPYKEHFVWYPYDRDEMPYDLTLFDDLFAFVTFEDSEPTSIKDVLNNCEVVNDAEE